MYRMVEVCTQYDILRIKDKRLGGGVHLRIGVGPGIGLGLQRQTSPEQDGHLCRKAATIDLPDNGLRARPFHTLTTPKHPCKRWATRSANIDRTASQDAWLD